mgnify:CR=1 FL=1
MVELVEWWAGPIWAGSGRRGGAVSFCAEGRGGDLSVGPPGPDSSQPYFRDMFAPNEQRIGL